MYQQTQKKQNFPPSGYQSCLYDAEKTSTEKIQLESKEYSEESTLNLINQWGQSKSPNDIIGIKFSKDRDLYITREQNQPNADSNILEQPALKVGPQF